MAGVPINFAVPMEQSVASYSWTDIANGQGMVKMYFNASKDVNNTEYILTSFPLDIGATDSVYNGTKDFYMSKFNTSRTVSGTAYLRWYISITSNSYAGLEVEFFKRSNGTSTSISSKIRISERNVFGNQVDRKGLISIPITKTKFDVGDELFIRIIANNSCFFWAGGVPPDNNYIYIPFDIEL